MNNPSAAQGQGPDQVSTYKTTDSCKLDLHIFYPPGHESGQQRPAVVFFFGGGWIGGEPTL